MKIPVRTLVSVVLVIVTVIALPYLFFFQPSVWFTISSRVSGDARVDTSPQSTRSADRGPRSEVATNSAWDPSSEIPASSEEDPSSEVPANFERDPSPDIPARSQVPANSTGNSSTEVPANSTGNPSSEVPVNSDGNPSSQVPASSEVEPGLLSMLQRASNANKTVIITTLNQAWATPGTMIDVFLESFRRGEATEPLLQHLVMVTLDQRSFQRCQELHEHCFMLRTPGVDFSGSKGFMSHDFLKMMWRRMHLLRRVLELGYNFVFTDADILWLRNPFEHFARDADFQISCDKNRGNAWSTRNKPNCGYQYAISNKRTIAMYQRWCRGGSETPDVDEQTLLNQMLRSHAFAASKVRIRFLPTERFSGFCKKSKNMSRVVTMHANCCTGLENKVHDLRTALSAWEAAKSLAPDNKTNEMDLWHVPKACLHSLWPSPPPPPASGANSSTKFQNHGIIIR